MKKLRITAIALILLNLYPSAWSMVHNPFYGPGRWFVNSGIGMDYPDANNTNYVSPGVGWLLDKYVTHRVNNSPLWTVGLGYRYITQTSWMPYYSLGLNYTYVTPEAVKGFIYQYSLANFENYDYQYHIQRHILFGTLKVNLFGYKQFLPFLTGNLGLSFNSASSYSETARPGVTPRISPGFGGETNIYGSYALGIGFDYLINCDWYASLEYRYGWYGSVHTGEGNESYSGASLKTTLRSSSMLLSANYLMDKLF